MPHSCTIIVCQFPVCKSYFSEWLSQSDWSLSTGHYLINKSNYSYSVLTITKILNEDVSQENFLLSCDGQVSYCESLNPCCTHLREVNNGWCATGQRGRVSLCRMTSRGHLLLVHYTTHFYDRSQCFYSVSRTQYIEYIYHILLINKLFIELKWIL